VPIGNYSLRVLLSEVVSISSRSIKSPSAITKNGSSTSPNFASNISLSKVSSRKAGLEVIVEPEVMEEPEVIDKKPKTE